MVVGHGQVAVFRRWVPPGDDEHRVPVLHEIFHEGVVGGEVENVVLHDPRRDNEDRLRVDLLRRGGVLDQFEEPVAEHDLAGRHGHLFAGPEVLGARWQFPVALAAPVLHHVLKAADQVLSALLLCCLDQERVGPEEVRR